MKYFEEREFACKCSQDSQARMSDCGSSGGQLPSSVRANIVALVNNVLDPAREQFDRPVAINSGYRCQKHNLEVGGVANSQHLRGEAADIHCADNERLAKIIEANGRFDQMIRYLDKRGKIRFIHVSWKRLGGNRHQVLCKQ